MLLENAQLVAETHAIDGAKLHVATDADDVISPLRNGRMAGE